MCGCSKNQQPVRNAQVYTVGKLQTVQSVQSGAPAKNVNFGLKPGITSNVPPNFASPPVVPNQPIQSEQDRRRIQKIRQQAIREALNR